MVKGVVTSKHMNEFLDKIIVPINQKFLETKKKKRIYKHELQIILESMIEELIKTATEEGKAYFPTFGTLQVKHKNPRLYSINGYEGTKPAEDVFTFKLDRSIKYSLINRKTGDE